MNWHFYADARREGWWWVVDVFEPEVTVRGRTRRQARRMAVDAVVCALGCDRERVTVDVEFVESPPSRGWLVTVFVLSVMAEVLILMFLPPLLRGGW